MKNAFSYVRFSTPEQEMGDSERRQIALAENYCARNGLNLVETVADRGVSGFHGKNHKDGNLARLLKVLRPGDLLLIEDCDRWSRENPLDALNRLQAEVRKGVEVIFLRTGVKVTADNFNDPSILVPNFFSGLLASQESQKKSERITASWAAKKQAIKAGRAVNLAHLPCWLAWEGTKEAGKVIVVENKAETVRQIFDLANRGCGPREIVRTLRDTPPITDRKKARWNPATVARILRNKAVLGFATIVDPPMPGVYPPIVSEQVFYSATRRLETAPRVCAHTGAVTNLFTGLVKCAQCGASLIVHRYSGEKLGLLCSERRYGRRDCGSSCIPLNLFERATLDFLGDADVIRGLLTVPVKVNKSDELEGRLLAARKQVAKLSGLIFNDAEPSPTIYGRLKAEESQVKKLSAELEEEHARAKAGRSALQEYDEFVVGLPAMAADASRRAELRRAIGTVVDRVMCGTHSLPGLRRVWECDIFLKDASNAVTMRLIKKPEGWCFQSLRPVQFIQKAMNLA